ncbi:hypothetical protein M9458_053819 [Cirrhinus mrigala]|uniref:Retrotransposon gag domain-containing protein n=1 Tax=Cirrhinus mrigala TaxID=683832 RepID=A0ABD0MPL3_CIRMR
MCSAAPTACIFLNTPVTHHSPSDWTHLESLTCTTYEHMHSTQSAAGLKVSTVENLPVSAHLPRTSFSSIKTITISLLTGRALQWAGALWNSESPLIYSLSGFVKHYKEVFSQATTEISVHDELLRLQQADLTIHDYTVRFRTLAASSGWTALLAAFRRGLMAIYEDSVGLESFLQKASHISQHITACHREFSPTAAATPEPTPPAPDPIHGMQNHAGSAPSHCELFTVYAVSPFED